MQIWLETSSESLQKMFVFNHHLYKCIINICSYRGTPLILISDKASARIMRNIMKVEVDSIMRKEQAGFREICPLLTILLLSE